MDAAPEHPEQRSRTFEVGVETGERRLGADSSRARVVADRRRRTKPARVGEALEVEHDRVDIVEAHIGRPGASSAHQGFPMPSVGPAIASGSRVEGRGGIGIDIAAGLPLD